MKTWLAGKSAASPRQRERNRFLFVFGINTGKERRHLINSQLREEIAVYTAGLKSEELLFPFRKGGHLSRI